ncbi:hypothetical protein EPN52_07660 [bacterium]|nr:MAG: hypothetical protein EPN52_07660 [bacterium]
MPDISTEAPLPRLAPHLVSRPKLSSWLKRHAEVPVRILAAPSGSGKYSAIVTYLQERGSGAFLHVQREEPLAALRRRLARALGLAKAPATFDELLAALCRCAPVEIAFYDVAFAAEDALEEIDRLINEAPAGVNIIVGTRSRALVDISRMLANGSAVLCDAQMLAFEEDEAARLAQALDVCANSGDIAALLRESEGWAVVTAGVLRHAAGSGRPLGGAFEDWFRKQGRLFGEFIKRELELSSERERDAFRRLIGGVRTELPGLESTGLFVRYDESGYHPYRIVARLCGGELGLAAAEGTPAPPLAVRMFGRFEAEIGGQPIPWVRRRDQDLFKYLLLKRDASASRGELVDTFWPHADPHLAGQCLRTACANIRKAIASLVGNGGAELYLDTGAVVSLNLSHIVLDVHQFKMHVTAADAAYEQGHHDEAIAGYRAADALYRGALLQEDAQAPWFAPRIALYQELYLHELERQGECWLAKGEPVLARQCAYRILNLDPAAAGGRSLVERALAAAPPRPQREGRERVLRVMRGGLLQRRQVSP